MPTGFGQMSIHSAASGHWVSGTNGSHQCRSWVVNSQRHSHQPGRSRGGVGLLGQVHMGHPPKASAKHRSLYPLLSGPGHPLEMRLPSVPLLAWIFARTCRNFATPGKLIWRSNQGRDCPRDLLALENAKQVPFCHRPTTKSQTKSQDLELGSAVHPVPSCHAEDGNTARPSLMVVMQSPRGNEPSGWLHTVMLILRQDGNRVPGRCSVHDHAGSVHALIWARLT